MIGNVRRAVLGFRVFGAAARADDAPPPRVVFRSFRDDAAVASLYVMERDGTGLRRLPTAAGSVIQLAPAPDARRIAYVVDPDDTENFQLHVLDLAGGSSRRVGTGICFLPRWSPDGRRLAVMNHESGWRVRLTAPDVLVERPPQTHVGGDGAQSWSPDGTRIVFQSNRDRKLDLYLADAATGAPARLTDTAASETGPCFSPDGRWIGYEREGDVWRVRCDGTDAQNLTADAAKDGGFTWSPDSARLAFVSDRDGNEEIYVLDLATMRATNVSRNRARDVRPRWSPDGASLAFVSERDGNEEIYVLQVADRSAVRLTHHAARDVDPAWLAAAR
jgi:Tol biopolymer transport system component